MGDSNTAIMGSLHQWISCTDPRVYRIHLSHTDMDGYGCQVVSYVHRMMYYIAGINTPRIIYENMGYNPNSQKEVIRRAVAEATSYGYRPGMDVLSFLVTDISRFDPRTAFADLGPASLIHWIVVDHHIDHIGLNHLEDRVEYPIATLPDYPLWLHNRYYVSTDEGSAMYMLFHLMTDHDVTLTQEKFENDLTTSTISNAISRIMDELEALSRHVSLSDTGHWEHWADNVAASTPAAKVLCERLCFEYYANLHIEKRWFWDACTLMLMDTSIIGNNGYANWLFMEERPRIIKENWDRLRDCYHDVVYNSIQTDLTSRIKGIEGLVTMQYIPSDTNRLGHLFSMISAEYLRKHPDVDLLVIDYPESKMISLRSAKDSVDCSAIAALNGGGGHPRSSGFRYE